MLRCKVESVYGATWLLSERSFQITNCTQSVFPWIELVHPCLNAALFEASQYRKFFGRNCCVPTGIMNILLNAVCARPGSSTNKLEPPTVAVPQSAKP